MKILFVLALIAAALSAIVVAQPSPPTGFTINVRNTFPNASTTGVPAGTSLTNYTGPCTITTPNTVIDSKTISCGFGPGPSLFIEAANVTIRKSVVNGGIYLDQACLSSGCSLTIEDSRINLPDDNSTTGIADVNWVARRIHIEGGFKGGYCNKNCTLEYSYIHTGFEPPVGNNWHMSAIRIEQDGVFRFNTFHCDAIPVPPDSGCSASMTGYPDWAPVKNNTIEGNLFRLAPDAAYCMYGGITANKPFSNDPTTGTYMVVRNNIFERTASVECAAFGAVTDWRTGGTGNVWTGNKWFPDGVTLAEP